MQTLFARSCVIPVVLTSMAAGCAGVGGDILVETQPAGARCEINSGARTLHVIESTPAPVPVDVNFSAMFVTCEKDGFHSQTASLAGDLEGMTFGSVLVGGSVAGGPVSAPAVGSGRGEGYVPRRPAQRITLTLRPTAFTSPARRDAYYKVLTDRVRAETQLAVEKTRKQCDTGSKDCDTRVDQVARRGSRQLIILESQRLAATIDEQAAGTGWTASVSDVSLGTQRKPASALR